MMFDLNYQDRLTWLKTIIVFDTTRNKYLNPFLGKRSSDLWSVISQPPKIPHLCSPSLRLTR